MVTMFEEIGELWFCNFSAQRMKFYSVNVTKSPIPSIFCAVLIMASFTELVLTLPVPCISESYIEMKIELIFVFTLLCVTSKGFMKPFESPQRV